MFESLSFLKNSGKNPIIPPFEEIKRGWLGLNHKLVDPYAVDLVFNEKLQEEVKLLEFNEQEDSFAKTTDLASLNKKKLKSSIGTK